MTLLLLLFLTLLLVPAAAATHALLGRNTGWMAAVVLLIFTGAAFTWLPQIAAGETISEYLPWLPTVDVGVSLRLDGLGLVFLLLVLFIGALVMAYSTRYFSPDKKTSDFYLWMLLFVFAMSGMVMADDLILLFVFWEFTTLCSYFLINRSGPKGAAPAQRTLLITVAGGLALLAAVLWIIARTGTTSLSEALSHEVWAQDPVFTSVVAVLIALAAFTKSAQFPFHFWLPDAMVAPAPVSAYLHAAAMVKAGTFLLLRFSPAFEGVLTWQILLLSVGLVTALMGAFFALRVHDIKELMAYSTVSQLGFLVAIIGVGTPTAITAAIIHVIAHALFKSGLFMMVGIIEHESGSRDIRELNGLARTMPVSLVITVLGSLSMAGVPPLLGFLSKEHLLEGFLSGTYDPSGFSPVLAWTLALIAVVAAIGTFGYCGRIVLGAFSGYQGVGRDGDTRELMSPDTAHEAPVSFYLPALIPVALSLILGFVAFGFNDLVSSATLASSPTAVAEGYQTEFALYHGFSAYLVLSIVVIVVGSVLVLARNRVDRLLPQKVLPFTAVELAERIRLGAINGGRRVGDLTRTDMHGLHLSLPGVFLALVCVAGLLTVRDVGPLDPGHSRPTDWVLNGLLVVFLLGAVISMNRTAAVVLTGGAGFVVAAWYFSLGAVDVGMTQLLVEILTVVVLVLVLRKLPTRFHRVSKVRTGASAFIAIAFGVMAFLATFFLTGRRGRSNASQWYLENTYENSGAINIVNSILVDFRALDTLGELTVLGVAGFAILAVLNSAFSTGDNRGRDTTLWAGTPLAHSADNTQAMRSVFNWMAPFIVLLSLLLLVRGHYDSGGGFIAALVAGGFFALRYLVAPTDSGVKLRFDYAMVIVGGIIVGTAIGFTGYLAPEGGSYLRPIVIAEGLPLPWGSESGFTLTTALIFDVGIYLAVIGAVLVALDRLGQAQRYPAELLHTHMRAQGYSAEQSRDVELRTGEDPGDVPLQATEGSWVPGESAAEWQQRSNAGTKSRAAQSNQIPGQSGDTNTEGGSR